jgi:predicted metal-dependent hydrolase
MHSIQYGNKRIDYEIKRGNREKTVAIYVGPVPTVTVSTPRLLGEEKIRSIVRRKARWILEKQELLRRNRPPASKEFVNGESFPYLGRQYRLKVTRAAIENGGPCKLVNGRLLVEIDGSLGGEDGKKAVRAALGAWYLSHAEDKLRERTARLAWQIGRFPQGIVVKEQRGRWGSCSRTAIIRFNWKIITAPLSVVDYVIVHELCHLIYPHHSSSFWNRVESILPDYRERRRLLKSYSSQKDLWECS